MEVLMFTDPFGGTAKLTTDSSASSYGKPVLRVEAVDISGDYGPGDMMEAHGGTFPAAEVVAGWARNPKRTPEEVEMAKAFLEQWSDGPQVEKRGE